MNEDFDRKGRWGVGLGLGLAVVLLLGFAASRRNDESSSTDDRRYAAFSVCKDLVKDQLRAPGTAVFRDYFEDDGEVRVTGSGEGPYTVTSTVDSENGFGALLRSSFVCSVRPAGSAGGKTTWKLVDLNVT
jgi:hypothetical protein